MSDTGKEPELEGSARIGGECQNWRGVPELAGVPGLEEV